MRIDRETGVVAVPELAGALAPTTTRDEWLASAMGQGSRAGVVNGPWSTYSARGFTVDGRAWRLSAGFHGQTIHRVELMALGDEFGASWDDWSKAKEQARQQLHDRWLAQALGRGPTFTWGEVASVFDERAGYSSILVHYAVRDTLFPGAADHGP